MYQIGSFSKIVGMSVKTLRYYHEIGLLVPAEVDETSGYRYYTETEFVRADRIRFLKNYRFTLPEIKEVLDHITDESDLQAYLEEKNTQLDMQVRELRKVQKEIKAHLDQEVLIMTERTYTFDLVTLESQEVASIRYKGRYDNMGQYIQKLYKAVGGSAAGAPFALYYDEEYKEEDADIEVCVPVKKHVSKGDVTSRVLEGSKFLVTTHVGPYDEIHHAYKAITDEVVKRELQTTVPSREIYQKGPGMLLKGNPQKYRTDVMMQVIE